MARGGARPRRCPEPWGSACRLAYHVVLWVKGMCWDVSWYALQHVYAEYHVYSDVPVPAPCARQSPTMSAAYVYAASSTFVCHSSFPCRDALLFCSGRGPPYRRPAQIRHIPERGVRLRAAKCPSYYSADQKFRVCCCFSHDCWAPMHQLQTREINLFLILAHAILWWAALERNSTEIVQRFCTNL